MLGVFSIYCYKIEMSVRFFSIEWLFGQHFNEVITHFMKYDAEHLLLAPLKVHIDKLNFEEADDCVPSFTNFLILSKTDN